MAEKGYKADSITVLKGLENLRRTLDLEAVSNLKNEKNLGQIARELKVDEGSLKRAIEEYRILKLFPRLQKSKTNALSRLKLYSDLRSFCVANNVYELKVRELYKRVKEWRVLVENDPSLVLSQHQQDLILGSAIGDASIRQREKNCAFRVSHSAAQKHYFDTKLMIMREFVKNDINIREKTIQGRDSVEHQFSTVVHPALNYYRKLLYKNGTKTITRTALDKLTPQALAYWVCDDGSYCRSQNYIILCTNSYTIKEHKVMKRYFKEVWGIDPTIGFRDNKYYYLRFKKEDTKRLVSIIEKFIPRGMEYKIGNEQ